MKLAHSEVFENYVKIATDQGLVDDLTKEANDKESPRWDSNDLSAIEILYGVKPNGPKDDILDQAHPEPVVVAPAHDKVNGLVENLKERQNIMCGIALKPTNGLSTHHIFAQASQELLDEVVKVGFELDKYGAQELMIFADQCAEALSENSESITKTAWTWSELGALTGGAGAATALALAGSGPIGWALLAGGIAVVGLINHFGGMVDQGVIKNCDRAISELQDIIKEGNDDMSHALGQIQPMIKNIAYVQNLGKKAANSTITPSTSTPETIEAFKKLIEDYKTACITLAEYIPGYIDILKAHALMEGGERSSDVMAILKKVWSVVYPTEVKDAITALQTLQESLSASHKTIDTYKSSMESYLNKNKTDIVKSLEDLSNKHQEQKPAADHWHNEGNSHSMDGLIEKKPEPK